MPVRYDIAAGVPQAQGGGFDPMNAFATMQAMSYRQQQNALAELQMQKMQQELQQQNALRGVLSNLDVTNPAAVSALSRSGNLPEALSVMSAQRSGAAQSALAGHYKAQEDIARAKLPLEERQLTQQINKEERLAREALAKADTADLLRVKERTGMAQDIIARMIGDPDNYQANLDELYKFDPKVATHLPQDKYDEATLKRQLNTAASFREHAEKELANRQEQAKVSTSPVPNLPGYFYQTTPEGGLNIVAAPAPRAAMPTNMMTPAPVMRNSFANAPVVAPVAAPEPSEIIGTPQNQRREAARAILSVANYDPEKGGAYVADLIRKTPTSAWRESVARTEGKISGKASEEVQNVGRLRTIIDNMVLAATNFKLGGQISDADVRMLKEAQSDMGNPNLQPEERLSRWDEVMRIQAKMAGYKYIPVSAEETGKPIIGERKPAQVDEQSILTGIFGAKK